MQEIWLAHHLSQAGHRSCEPSYHWIIQVEWLGLSVCFSYESWNHRSTQINEFQISNHSAGLRGKWSEEFCANLLFWERDLYLWEFAFAFRKQCFGVSCDLSLCVTSINIVFTRQQLSKKLSLFRYLDSSKIWSIQIVLSGRGAVNLIGLGKRNKRLAHNYYWF